MQLAKRAYYTTLVRLLISKWHSAEWFWTLWMLDSNGPQSDITNYLKLLFGHFEAIHRDLNSVSDAVDHVEMSNVLSCLILLDWFQSVTWWHGQGIFTLQNQFLSVGPMFFLAFESSREVMVEWATQMINSSLQKDFMPSCLKDTTVCPILKKILAAGEVNNYIPVANIPFWGKLIENWLQTFLEGINSIDPF